MAESGSDAHDAALAALRSTLRGEIPQFAPSEGYLRLVQFGSATVQSGVWRLVTQDGVARTSQDDGQQFGLPRPVDAEREANAEMAGRPVTDVTVTPFSGDLVLLMGDRRLEFLVTSSGYESWEANFIHEGFDYLVVCNGGRLSVHSNPTGERPSVIHGGPWTVA